MTLDVLIRHTHRIADELDAAGVDPSAVRKMRDAMLRHQMHEDRAAWVQSVRRCARRAGA